MRSDVKIIKRNQGSRPKGQSDPDSKPGELTRETMITVKRWIAELREQKRNQKHSFAPLSVIGSNELKSIPGTAESVLTA